MNFIEKELVSIAQFLKIENENIKRFLKENGDADLGHISSGLDAANNPFFTIYFDDFTQIMNQKTNSN